MFSWNFKKSFTGNWNWKMELGIFLQIIGLFKLQSLIIFFYRPQMFQLFVVQTEEGYLHILTQKQVSH